MKHKLQNGEPIWVKVTAEIYPEEGYIEGAVINITASKILTESEKKVLACILDGKSNREIANLLHRSIRTVEDHRSSIMKKFNASNPAELAKNAIFYGFDCR